MEILRKFWPERGKGHIIVTSRNPYTASFRACASISVLPLNMEESVELFYNEIGRSQAPQRNLKIEKLLDDWKGVPLAINQMSSFITRVQMDLDKFVKLYSKSAPQLLRKANLYDEYPHSVATAFATEQLQEEPKAILHAMCFFDPDRIPCEVIQSSFDAETGDEEPDFNSVCEWEYVCLRLFSVHFSLFSMAITDQDIVKLSRESRGTHQDVLAHQVRERHEHSPSGAGRGVSVHVQG